MWLSLVALSSTAACGGYRENKKALKHEQSDALQASYARLFRV